jgi:hypothetical protein
MPKPSFLLVLALLSLVGLSGCALARHEVHALPAPAGVERGVVFAIDGAGGFLGASAALRQAMEEARLPLRMEPVIWSHGPGRVYADETDYAHARAEGLQLAGQVAAYRRACPGGAVYLVSHSAGSAVALTAVEALPPGSVDRVVLLAPSLSAGYDLRPALRRVRCSIEVFSSSRDWFYLGLATGLFGTADRRHGPAAGRVGFRPTVADAPDAALYAKLRQHPWDPSLAWTGHHGGHYGAYQPGYLRAYVLPLLQPPGPFSPRPSGERGRG